MPDIRYREGNTFSLQQKTDLCHRLARAAGQLRTIENLIASSEVEADINKIISQLYAAEQAITQTKHVALAHAIVEHASHAKDHKGAIIKVQGLAALMCKVAS